MRKCLGMMIALLVVVTMLTGCHEIQPNGHTPGDGVLPDLPPSGPHSTDLEVLVGEYQLHGKLTRPRWGIQSLPIVVVLIAGSGPNNMDAEAQQCPLFRDLADGLAAEGITSIRVDKRYLEHPELAVQGPTIQDEQLDDTDAAITLIQADPSLAGYHLYVIGHSQGAFVLPNVLQHNPAISGGVFLAGTPRSMWDVELDEESNDIQARTDLPREQQASRIADLAIVTAEMKLLDDPTGPALRGYQASYIVSFNNLHYDQAAKDETRPILILQGDQDGLVFPNIDYSAYQRLLRDKPNVTFGLIGGLGHFFDTAGHMDPDTIRTISNWLISESS